MRSFGPRKTVRNALRSKPFLIAVFLLFAALAGLLAAFHVYFSKSTTPHFTLGKDTTVITAPLFPNGTVNYIAALNEQRSEGVTPQNNAFVLVLQATGADVSHDEIWDAASRDKLFQLCGAPPTANNAELLLPFIDFLMPGHKSTDDVPSEMDPINVRHELWTAQEYRPLAAYLKKSSRSLSFALFSGNKSLKRIGSMRSSIARVPPSVFTLKMLVLDFRIAHHFLCDSWE